MYSSSIMLVQKVPEVPEVREVPKG